LSSDLAYLGCSALDTRHAREYNRGEFSSVEVSLKVDDCFQENILIDNGGNARLIDFGLSSFIQPPLSQFHLATTSTRHDAIRYAAPELLTSDDFRDLPSEKVDIYSFGCVMLQVSC